MQIVISPAKLMNFEGSIPAVKTTAPLFPEKTATLVEICRQLSECEIVAKMKVNATIAHHVYEYFQTFDFESTPRRAAALAYNGIAYKGLNAADFLQEDFDFARQHFNILSALYGILGRSTKSNPTASKCTEKSCPQASKVFTTFGKIRSMIILAANSKRTIKSSSTFRRPSTGEFLIRQNFRKEHASFR